MESGGVPGWTRQRKSTEKFEEASKSAREKTAKAAGAVEKLLATFANTLLS